MSITFNASTYGGDFLRMLSEALTSARASSRFKLYFDESLGYAVAVNSEGLGHPQLAPGMGVSLQVDAYSPLSVYGGSTSLIFTSVATYNSANGQVTFNDTVPLTEPSVSYYGTVGGDVKNLTGAYTLAGSTTVTTARELILLNANSDETHFEDFEGAYRYTKTLGSYRYTAANSSLPYGIAVSDNTNHRYPNLITFGHDSSEACTDGTCAGIAKVTVTEEGTQATLEGNVLKGYGSGATSVYAEFRVYIDSENTETDSIAIVMGLVSGEQGITSDGFGGGYYYLGNAIAYSLNEKANARGEVPVEVICKSDIVADMVSGYNLYAAAAKPNFGKWPIRKWFIVRFEMNPTTDIGTVNVNGESAAIGNALDYGTYPPVAAPHAFLKVAKTKGANPMTVYVDYIHSGN